MNFLVGCAAAKSIVALTAVEFSSSLKSNIFEMFFMVIFSCINKRGTHESQYCDTANLANFSELND